jgi:anti-sigma regulatory factor (Ser/Thr protein kinase)
MNPSLTNGPWPLRSKALSKKWIDWEEATPTAIRRRGMLKIVENVVVTQYSMNAMKHLNGSNYSVIALERFIQSTRDSGYKTTASAVAELVDNSLQAGATVIDIRVIESGDSVDIMVIDNGCGMDAQTLREALRFGGSSRFDDRTGMGRYGMGLPNASVSQARHVGVFSWKRRQGPLWSYLDVDEIARGQMSVVPEPVPRALPDGAGKLQYLTGTIVTWTRCDRLDNRRISTTCRKLHESLGRIFRYFIWDSVKIQINGQAVTGVDPLFLHPKSSTTGAVIFEEEARFEVAAQPENPKSPIGDVIISFAELPVGEWQALPNDDKRRLGIANGAGVSIVRAGREVDFGWFFMGNKRRENYDDWWRCEIKFDPVLDEAFGITHTKQQIRPQSFLLETLQPHMETVGRVLNARARAAHLQVKTVKAALPAIEIANARDQKLRPVPARSALKFQQKPLTDLRKRNAALRSAPLPKKGEMAYRLIEDAAGDACFYRPLVGEGELVSAINTKHGFFRKLYEPLSLGESISPIEVAQRLQLLLLAATRAEAIFTRRDEQAVIEAFRKEWSEVLEVLLSAK